MGKAVGITAGLEYEREILQDRRRLTRLEVSLKPLHLGVLCSEPRLDLADRALMVGLCRGKALLPLGLPLVIASEGGFVGNAALVPFGKVLLAGAGQTSP